jgi:hypothetical protein
MRHNEPSVLGVYLDASRSSKDVPWFLKNSVVINLEIGQVIPTKYMAIARRCCGSLSPFTALEDSCGDYPDQVIEQQGNILDSFCFPGGRKLFKYSYFPEHRQIVLASIHVSRGLRKAWHK